MARTALEDRRQRLVDLEAQVTVAYMMMMDVLVVAHCELHTQNAQPQHRAACA